MMNINNRDLQAPTAIIGLILSVTICSKHTFAQSINELGSTYTCSGAIKAGGNGVDSYHGKWDIAPSGVTSGKGLYGNPYASEQPIVVITGENMDKYKVQLTPGQQALLKKYADYKILLYPSHRDFDVQGDCRISKQNAQNAKIINEGEGVTGVINGSAPFPFPKNGVEALWNTKIGSGTMTEEWAIQDTAAVNSDGSIAWGKEEMKVYIPTNKGIKWDDNMITAYYHLTTLLPERSKGEMISGMDYSNYATHPRKAWQYQPGTRRVRELPEFGFDFPRGPGGLRVVDDDRLFNGTPIRYNWTLKGRKEMIVPYNSYILENPTLKYSELLTPKFPNPALIRWEQHRVWEIEANLKPGMRHNYAKRVLFLDEDTWTALLSDYYDARGQLWRTAIQNTVFAYDIKSMHPRTTFYIDLQKGAYYADRMWQQGRPIVLNSGKNSSPSQYGANALRAEGK